MEKRVVEKALRLRMSEELGRMLSGIPVEVREQRAEGVYKGTGVLVAGMERPDVELRVFLDGRELRASMVSKKARIEFTAPFATADQRSDFLEIAKTAIRRSMN